MLQSLARQLGPALRWQVLPVLGAWSLSTRSLKQTTGIVGLPVDPDARQHLKERLQEMLQRVQELIPEHAEYRKVVEATANYRMKLLDSPATDEEIEDKLDAQLEQLIKQCNDELSLIPKMAVPACLWLQRLKVELLLQVDITIEEDVEDPTKAPAK